MAGLDSQATIVGLRRAVRDVPPRLHSVWTWPLCEFVATIWFEVYFFQLETQIEVTSELL